MRVHYEVTGKTAAELEEAAEAVATAFGLKHPYRMTIEAQPRMVTPSAQAPILWVGHVTVDTQ